MNNNYDEIDDLLFTYFKSIEDTTPEMIHTAIKFNMNNKIKKAKSILLIKRIIISIISFFTITGGVVFASEIKEFVYNLKVSIFGTYDYGISTALKNDYDEEIEMDYVSSNNTNLKINQILLDEYNLGIVCDIKLTENLSNLIDIEFKNILIVDENSNILYAKYENMEELNKYCNEKNLDIGEFESGFSDGSYTGRIIHMQDNNIIFSFYTSSKGFPNSEKLYIKFDTIYLTKRNEDDKIIDGIWEMNIDLENMSKKRKEIEYSVVNINDDKTKVTKSTVSMSKMRLEFITDSNKIDFEKLQNRNINTFAVNDMIPFHEMYIETEEGKKFFQSNYGSNGYDTIEKGKIKYYVTFDYTYYDIYERIKIIMPTNKDEELIIELKTNSKEAQ